MLVLNKFSSTKIDTILVSLDDVTTDNITVYARYANTQKWYAYTNDWDYIDSFNQDPVITETKINEMIKLIDEADPEFSVGRYFGQSFERRSDVKYSPVTFDVEVEYLNNLADSEAN